MHHTPIQFHRGTIFDEKRHSVTPYFDEVLPIKEISFRKPNNAFIYHCHIPELANECFSCVTVMVVNYY